MKVKIDLSQFKLKHRNDKTATLLHKDGHEVRLAIKALHPANRNNLEKLQLADNVNDPTALNMAEGGEVNEDSGLDREPKDAGDVARKASAKRQLESAKPMIREYERAPKGDRPMGPDTPVNPKAKKTRDADPYQEGAESLRQAFEGKQRFAEGGEAINYDALIPQSGEQPFGTPPQSSADIASPMASSVASSIAPQAQQSPMASMPIASSPEALAAQGNAPSSMPMAMDNGLASGDKPLPPGPSQVSGPMDELQAAQQSASTNPTLMGGAAKQMSAVAQTADIQAKLANAQAGILKSSAKAMQDVTEDYQTHYAALDKERRSYIDDIKNNHIDPNRYMGSMDTGQRIGTAIGLFLGGLGSGGGHNQALDFLNKQIDRDINAQQAELSKKHTLLSANMQEFGNLRQATDMTRLMMMDQTKVQIEQAAAKANSPMAKARALQMIGALEQQMAPMQQQMALKQMLAQPNGSLHKIDPATLIQQLVPGDKQKEVAGQVEAAQNTRHMAKQIMSAFEQAVNENTVLKTGAGMLRTPASVYALHQHMQPTFKDLEGTVRQAAMDNTFKNITPQPGDTAHTIATKRNALQEYLQSKSSAPLAKSFGIDLEKFESTASHPESRLDERSRQMLELARQNPTHPRAQMIFKKLGIGE